MNGSESFWVVASGIVLVLFAAVVFARRVSLRQTSSSDRARHAAWVVAAATSMLVLASIAMMVTGLEREVTIVDVLALAIAGIAAGVLLARGSAFRSHD